MTQRRSLSWNSSGERNCLACRSEKSARSSPSMIEGNFRAIVCLPRSIPSLAKSNNASASSSSFEISSMRFEQSGRTRRNPRRTNPAFAPSSKIRRRSSDGQLPIPHFPALDFPVQTTRRQTDVFSAGCSTCSHTIELIAKMAAAGGHELRIHDMHQEHVARRADELGVHSIPAVAIVFAGEEARSGEFAPIKAMKLAACCTSRGPNEADIREALATS
jgi:Thioredoxin domain